MKLKTTLLLGIVFSLLTACVGARYYETEPVRVKLRDSLAKTKQVLNETESDFAQKNALYGGMKTAAKGEAALGLRDSHTTMKTSLESAKKLAMQMQDAVAAYERLTDKKKQLSSTDKEWDRATQLAASYDASLKAFNEAVLNYSRATGSFTSIANENKLLTSANVKDITSRLKAAHKKNQTALSNIGNQIKSATELAKRNGRAFSEATKSTLKAERNSFEKNLLELGKTLESLSAEYNKPAITSKDAAWNRFQKLVADAEAKISTMNEISERLPREISALLIQTQKSE